MTLILVAGAILLGWFVGTFINYAADVLPVTRRFTPVLCAACQCPRSLEDYLLMMPCQNCGQQRSKRAWAVPVIAAVALALLAVFPLVRVSFWVGVLLVTYFGVVIVIDMEHRLILHPVSLAGSVLAGVIGLFWHGWLPTLLGGLAGFGIMLALYFFGFLFAKGLGRMRGQAIDEEALGFGDVNLSGVLGLLLGWPGITAGLIFAILIGGLGGLAVMGYSVVSKKYQAFQAIPYGPFLVLGAVVALLAR